jgi:hypothetical protein
MHDLQLQTQWERAGVVHGCHGSVNVETTVEPQPGWRSIREMTVSVTLMSRGEAHMIGE